MCYFCKRGRNESSLFLRSPQKVPSKSWFWVIVWYNPGMRKGPATAFRSSVFILWTDFHVSFVTEHSVLCSQQLLPESFMLVSRNSGFMFERIEWQCWGSNRIHQHKDASRSQKGEALGFTPGYIISYLWPNLETFSASIFFHLPSENDDPSLMVWLKQEKTGNTPNIVHGVTVKEIFNPCLLPCFTSSGASSRYYRSHLRGKVLRLWKFIPYPIQWGLG